MTRILFVDDESRILEGLARMLRSARREWEMTFVTSGQAALAEFEKAPFDVVVSDMRMPQMDGANLLREVQKRFPEAVRIVLSGHTEQEAALRAIPIAHQFLNKPCDADTLREVITRARSLQMLLTEHNLREQVTKIGSLPSLPRVYAALLRAVEDPNTTLAQAAAIVARDLAICSKVLQVVNSGFFGLPRRITSIETAVSLLGFTTLKNIVLSIEVGQSFAADGPHAVSLEAEQAHGLLTVSIAKRLGSDKREAEDAFSAALLHDVGALVLGTRLPEQFRSVRAAREELKRPLHELEAERLGVSHAEIGAYLLGIWGFPYPIVEAVANHHVPWRVPHERFGLVDIVYVASTLAVEQEQPPAAGASCSPGLDLSYLETLGVADSVSTWRAMAAELVSGSGAG